MKNLFSFIILFSIFLVQIHLNTHVEFGEHSKSHHCHVCEIKTQHISFVYPAISFDFSNLEFTDNISRFYYSDVYPSNFISKTHSARAPPVI